MEVIIMNGKEAFKLSFGFIMGAYCAIWLGGFIVKHTNNKETKENEPNDSNEDEEES